MPMLSLSLLLTGVFPLVLAVAFAPRLGAQQALTAEQAARAHAISLKLRCVCGGCNDTVGTCNHTGGAFSGPCDTAKSMLKEIDLRVSRGESDDLILQDFVQEYGPTVLISPPAKGFNWFVWVMPVILPILALLLIWEVVRRWRRRAALALASGPAISEELLGRARREAGGGPNE
jgi:cytochrome c-type biogenesis protein CcmH/NrfF